MTTEDEGNDPIRVPYTTAVMQAVAAWTPEADKPNYKEMHHTVICDRMIAADFLGMKDFVDELAQAMANQLKGKTPHEIREQFGIENDFTKEEEKKVLSEIRFIDRDPSDDEDDD